MRRRFAISFVLEAFSQDLLNQPRPFHAEIRLEFKRSTLAENPSFQEAAH
jgi:hypothetical protein